MAKDKPGMDRTTDVPSKKVKNKRSVVVGRIEVQQILQKDIEAGLFALAEHNLQGAFGIAIRHIDKQWAIDAFLTLAKKYHKEGVEAALEHGDTSLIEKVLPLVRNLNELMNIIMRYKDRPWVEETLRKIAKEDPHIVMVYVNHYKDQPWAEKLLRMIARTAPSYVVGEADKFKEQSWAKRMIMDLVDVESTGVLLSSNRFIDQPWAEEVIKKAAKRDPKSALICAYRFVDQPWAEEVIRKAADEEPEVALEYAEHFANQPWAKDLIISLQKRES